MGTQGGMKKRKRPPPPPPPPKRKRGRPTRFSEALGARICEGVAAGMSLRAVCRSANTPDESTVRGWVLDRPDFAVQFRRALEVKAHQWADELVELADEEPPVVDGRVDSGAVHHQRLKIDTRKWIVSRMLPKVFGDRLQLAGDPDSPLTVLTDSEAARQAALLLSRAAVRRAEAENGDPAPRDPEDKSKPIREARKKTPAPTTEAAPASEPETVFTIPRQWILEAQRRWRAPAARPLVSAAGVALTADGSCTIVRRADRFIDQPTRKLQDAQAIFDAAGGAVPIAMIGAGAQLFAERCGKVGLTVNVLHATIDRPKLEMTLRSALDPEGTVRLGLPPGTMDEAALLAVALALNVDGHEQRHFQPATPPTHARRVQRPPHDPFREV